MSMEIAWGRSYDHVLTADEIWAEKERVVGALQQVGVEWDDMQEPLTQEQVTGLRNILNDYYEERL